ncbi:MAG TPA: NADPH-dependent F420 reductase [Gammaproteobacteria bacterium]
MRFFAKLTLAALAVCLASVAAPRAAFADTIAVIGTGNVGSALGVRFAALGHRIVYGSREPDRPSTRALVERTGGGATAATPAEAARDASIVILAVPWSSVETVVRGLGDLSGKIVVDPTNPRIDAPDGFRDYAIEGSIAELVQRLAPGARVVKAFSTLGAETMLDPSLAEGPVTIPIVGDDRDANAKIAELARGIGFEALDVGPLRHARILEGLHFLRWNAVGGPINYHFRPDNARR